MSAHRTFGRRPQVITSSVLWLLVAAMRLLISTLVEQGVIDHLAIRLLPAASFHESVFRANYLTLGTALFIAALKSLPGRLKEPNVLFPQ